MEKIKWKYKYKNLLFLGISTFIAVFSLSNSFVRETLVSYLSSLSYIGSFLAGILFPYTLTAPISGSIFIIISKIVNPLISSVIGAFGAVLGDYLIFKFVKHHLADEIKEILKGRREKLEVPERYRKIIPILAGFIIASPLPDEIGVALLGMSEFEKKKFLCFSYSLHFAGILLLVYLGRMM